MLASLLTPRLLNHSTCTHSLLETQTYITQLLERVIREKASTTPQGESDVAVANRARFYLDGILYPGLTHHLYTRTNSCGEF